MYKPRGDRLRAALLVALEKNKGLVDGHTMGRISPHNSVTPDEVDAHTVVSYDRQCGYRGQRKGSGQMASPPKLIYKAENSQCHRHCL